MKKSTLLIIGIILLIAGVGAYFYIRQKRKTAATAFTGVTAGAAVGNADAATTNTNAKVYTFVNGVITPSTINADSPKIVNGIIAANTPLTRVGESADRNYIQIQNSTREAIFVLKTETNFK